MKNKAVFSALACGVISAALDFWLIPSYFARGIPDYIWMAMMILLPAVAAIFLLDKYPTKTVLWSMAVQCVIVMALAKPIGEMLGYHLGDIANDLFDYIAYLIFVFGWISGATLVQVFSLLIVKKLHK